MELSSEERIKDNEYLMIYADKMRDFDSIFCEEMNNGSDFTVRFEIHGCGGRLLHARVYHDSICRPTPSSRKKECPF